MTIALPPDATDLWIVTDLDGSLLDEKRYTHDAAREALDRIAKAEVTVVFATGKTRAEVEQVAVSLPVRPIVIAENGGEIVVPVANVGDPLIIPLGVRRDLLLTHLAGIASETGAIIRGFARMSVAETAARTGLSEPLAVLARKRHYDEPFLLENPDRLSAVIAAAMRRGLRVTHGGRWHHLTGNTDKGAALTLLLESLTRNGKRPFMVGLGDAANDFSFLRVVDRPIVIPRPHGIDPSLATALPDAECAPYPGPAGWNAAVLTVFAGGRLPRVGFHP